MKRFLPFFSLFLFCLILLSGCTSNNISKLTNVEWKSDSFDITLVPGQLFNTANKTEEDIPAEKVETDYFTTITYDSQEKLAWISMEDGKFVVNLVNEKHQFYSIGQSEFLYGHYELEKTDNETYDYIVFVSLNGGSYKEYCQSSGIIFPSEMHFYGYIQ